MTLTGPPSTIRVVIVCKDPNFAGALASMAEAGDLTVSAIVDSLSQLAKAVGNGEVDTVVAVDTSIFPPDRVMDMATPLPVLFLGHPNDSAAMIASVEAGALGFIDSDASFQEIGQAVRSVAAGIPVVLPSMLGPLLRHVVRRRREEREAQDRLKILTGRERQIFELVASGLDKYGIGETLFISPETARTHIHNILTKLELHSQADLLALASQCGFEIGRKDD